MLWDLQRMIQLVQRGGVHWAKKVWWFRKAPVWAGRGGWRRMSTPQKKAILCLAETAYSVHGKYFGKREFPEGIPAVAYEVKKACSVGEGGQGGKTRKERSEERHKIAGKTIEQIKKSIT